MNPEITKSSQLFIYLMGPYITTFILFLVGYFAGRERWRKQSKENLKFPKIALILIAVFMPTFIVCGENYLDCNYCGNWLWFFIGSFFSWTILPYFGGLGLFIWMKPDTWQGRVRKGEDAPGK